MTKNIVMLHGANEGGWCFDKFKAVFEGLGWTCHAPDLIGHGSKGADAATKLVGIGMADYRAELEAFLDTLPPRPVLLGHSMGAVLAQQLAAQGRARALILVAPAPRAGILPPTEAEKKLDRDLMGLGSFWNSGDQSRFRSCPGLHFELRARGRAARRVRPIRARIRPCLLSRCSSGCSIGPVRPRSTPKPCTCPVLCLVGADDRSCRRKPRATRRRRIAMLRSGSSRPRPYARA